MGASKAINVAHESLDDAMRELGMEEGFDVGFEMSGNAAALREMLRTMNHGGSISMLGIPPGETAIDWNQVIFKGLVIKGIYGREMFETWYKMASMLQSGLNVRPVITHRLGVNDYREGFEIMNSGKSGKVILDWSADAARLAAALAGSPADYLAPPALSCNTARATQAWFVKLAVLVPCQELPPCLPQPSRTLTPICFRRKRSLISPP
jgi:hypothetical protein